MLYCRTSFQGDGKMSHLGSGADFQTFRSLNSPRRRHPKPLAPRALNSRPKALSPKPYYKSCRHQKALNKKNKPKPNALSPKP